MRLRLAVIRVMSVVFLCTSLALGQGRTFSPDSLYLRFTEAYDELDPDKISNLYTEQAELLNLYDGAGASSLKGRPAIHKYFEDFFGQVKSQGQKLRLTFKIADRKVSGNHILDNGYYQLDIITPGKPAYTGFGKFSVVLEPTADGYHFKTDATTNADFLDYENTLVKTIPERETVLYPDFYQGLLGDYMDGDGRLLVVGRSQTRLFVYEENDGSYRGLEKVNATTWTAGNKVRSGEVLQTFVFNNDTLLVRGRDGSERRAVKKAMYQTEDVAYRGKSGMMIRGTLFVPGHPSGKAIVLVHGSGPQDRNGYASYIRLMADQFARNGITVLTYDKRGVGASEGNSETAGFADLAGDALAGLDYLRKQRGSGLNKFGLGGSSQAGWVIAKALEERSDSVDFVLTIGAAGSGIKVIEQNLYNTASSMRCAAGFSEKQIGEVLRQQRYFFDFLKNRSNARRLDKYTAELRKDSLLRDWLFPMSNEVDLDKRDQWFTALEVDFDPLPVWKHYQKPALMIFNALDDATPSVLVKGKVDGLMNKNIRTVMLPAGQHLGLEATDICKAALTDVSAFPRSFFSVITTWLAAL